MEERRNSPNMHAPEVTSNQQRDNFGLVGSDDYEYYEPPPSTIDRNRSPVPEYQQYGAASPPISASSPPLPSSDIGRSPQLSDGGFSKSRPLSPSVQYSEIHSPDPQAVYNQGEKEAVYVPRHSKVPSYSAAPVVPGIAHQNSNEKPQVWVESQAQHQSQKKPLYKRWLFWLILIALLIIIAVAVACGVVFGTKKSSNSAPDSASGSNSNSSAPTGDDRPVITGDPNVSVGGYLSDAFYSTSGAWNGSGIAIAAADPTQDQTIYAFYQDYNGDIMYTYMDSKMEWNFIGLVSGDHKPLNGTPLSTVAYTLNVNTADALQKWHLFFIDEEYTIIERIITNTSSVKTWADGPLCDENIKTWQSDTIGLQACYWGNYYGEWSYGTDQAGAGIHLWYASDATVFQQRDYANGTGWSYVKRWEGLSGNGGVGCQTWFGMTEYAWFVDTENSLAMYWRDQNQSASSTSSHPIGEWTRVNNLGVDNVQQSSSLGYTNYMLWQDRDSTIKGANVTWAAENTTIATTEDGDRDMWTLQQGGEDVHAILGTHLSITAIASGDLLVFLQEEGDDMQMYIRDSFTPGVVFQQAGEDPVDPNRK